MTVSIELSPTPVIHYPHSCPSCGRTMVFRCVFRQEHPGLVDPVDASDWRWFVEWQRDESACQCDHTLNVERWEADRVRAELEARA